ncbi:MAG TPA: DNA-formamidopyrimidine glycosylase family protein [Acidimicrobiales bacterium]|nr:DNA-formamidopyrimidine glycosylase family protein [Acidimicrobiales bacterium]
MPELPEVEAYRRLAERALGRRIVEVDAPDSWYLKAGAAPAVLVGRAFTAARRIGKLLLLDTDGGPTLGLRFGMTGRLVVDGAVGVDRLLYSSDRALDAWDRFAVRFADGGDLRVRDPRRLGGVLLDPDESGLGPDALGVTLGQLRAALAGSVAPLKARLMDQARVAGIGNLLADEALWRAGLAPARPAASLSTADVRRLHRHLVGTVTDLIERGGSHTGDLMAERRQGGVCPKDGAPLRRDTVGGRTSWWCPAHQA